MQKGGKRTTRPFVLAIGCTGIARATLVSTGPPDAAFGSALSPQGAELTHGPASARLVSEVGSGACGRASTWRGPQQHEPPLHVAAHLQWCATVSDLCAGDTDAAKTCCAEPSATSSTAAKFQRQRSPIRLARTWGLTRDDRQKCQGARSNNFASGNNHLTPTIECQGAPPHSVTRVFRPSADDSSMRRLCLPGLATVAASNPSATCDCLPVDWRESQKSAELRRLAHCRVSVPFRLRRLAAAHRCP